MIDTETVSDILDEYGEGLDPKAKPIDRAFYERLAKAIARMVSDENFKVIKARFVIDGKAKP